MKGKLERQKLHDRITSSGTEEQKAILARVEARVEVRRQKQHAARMAKQTTSRGLFGGFGSGKKKTAILPAIKTEEKDTQRKKKKKKKKKNDKKLQDDQLKLKEEEKEEETKEVENPKAEDKEVRSKGQDLASWGDEGDDY